MLQSNKTGLYSFAFVAILLLVFILMDYQHILFYRPQALHFMRQTDCLAFVQSYYNMGMEFFTPRVLNLQSTDGKSIGEFPILYYITASLYHVFGPHEFILRLINLTLISLGFFSVYKLLYRLFNDVVYALTFTFLFLSSTVLLYYASNFLPDAGALGLTLTALYFFIRFITSVNDQKSFILSTSLLILASLIKITYGIYLIAALLTFVLVKGFLKKKQQPKANIVYLLSYLVGLLLIAGWYLYLIYYNNINHVVSFLTTAMPIWKLSNEKISIVWDYIRHYWYYLYYYPTSFHVMMAILVIGLFLIKKSNKTILVFTTLTFLGSVGYIILFFNQFKDHDYYFLTLIPTIIFLVTNSFIAIKNKYPKPVNSWISKLILITIVVLSLNFGREKLANRYATPDIIYSPIGIQLNGGEHYLKRINIQPSETVIVIKDNTRNGSLYFLNRRGWTFADTTELAKSSAIFSQSDYLILTDTTLIYNTTIAPLPKIKVGEYNSAAIYKLIK